MLNLDYIPEGRDTTRIENERIKLIRCKHIASCDFFRLVHLFYFFCFGSQQIEVNLFIKPCEAGKQQIVFAYQGVENILKFSKGKVVYTLWRLLVKNPLSVIGAIYCCSNRRAQLLFWGDCNLDSTKARNINVTTVMPKSLIQLGSIT